MSLPVVLAVLLAMLVCLAVIPLGLPGLWLLIAIVAGLAAAGSLSWGFVVVAGAVAGSAEVAELLVLQRFGRVYGGSRRAFWGAVLGGMAGLFVGAPIPIVGPLATAFFGTFLGAGLVTYLETRSLRRSTRVGWGLVLARTAAVGLKVAVAVCVVAAVTLTLVR